MTADHWNDETYTPLSNKYPNLHDQFKERIDISHEVVNDMGELMPDKAKAKFSKLKNDLIVVKTNWEKSGNGDGTLDESENALIDANDKRIFLNGKSAAILYLWEKSETFNLLSTVVQMLDSDTSLDTAAENDVTSPAPKLLSQPSKKGD